MRLLFVGTASTIALAAPHVALAQASSAKAAPGSGQTTGSDAVEVGEIVVTAQKRQQSINDVGMSITAASGEQLAARGVADTSQLTKVVPGFNYNETAQASPVYTIRGIGYQDSSIAASPAVTVYVDEVPIPYSGGTLGAALDLERVEVLKGPQGTLFGSNSTGGAINYIAAKPTERLAAGANLRYGRFNTVDTSGFATSSSRSQVFISSHNWRSMKGNTSKEVIWFVRRSASPRSIKSAFVA